MVNTLLNAYIDRTINQPTVILSFKILLNNHRANGFEARMTKTQIETEFNRVHTQYGIETFRRDYVLRQCGRDRNAIDQHDDLFFIKPNFLEGMVDDDFAAVLDRIDTHWGAFQNQQQRMIDEIQSLIDNGTIEEKRTYVAEMLTDREAVKRGQAFEVASFAVLNTYLYALGFSLNRFSTTYSNDGGIDFVAQNAVYQVTTKLSERKFDEDIKKVTGKERVLIYKDLTRDFNMEHLNHDLVINHIGKDELLGFLDYLVAKNADRFLHLVLNVMKTEFLREFYQNDTQ